MMVWFYIIYIHAYIYTYIYIYICMCMYACNVQDTMKKVLMMMNVQMAKLITTKVTNPINIYQ